MNKAAKVTTTQEEAPVENLIFKIWKAHEEMEEDWVYWKKGQ